MQFLRGHKNGGHELQEEPEQLFPGQEQQGHPLGAKLVTLTERHRSPHGGDRKRPG